MVCGFHCECSRHCSHHLNDPKHHTKITQKNYDSDNIMVRICGFVISQTLYSQNRVESVDSDNKVFRLQICKNESNLNPNVTKTIQTLKYRVYQNISKYLNISQL